MGTRRGPACRRGPGHGGVAVKPPASPPAGGEDARVVVDAGVVVLADGRVHCWIEHAALAGVTPAMLHWWYARRTGTPRTEVLRLDDGGFIHRRHRGGLPVAVTNHRFDALAGGTRWRHTLTVGLRGAWARPLNALLRRVAFGEAQGRDWVQRRAVAARRVERDLPARYRSEGGAAWTAARRDAAAPAWRAPTAAARA